MSCGPHSHTSPGLSILTYEPSPLRQSTSVLGRGTPIEPVKVSWGLLMLTGPCDTTGEHSVRPLSFSEACLVACFQRLATLRYRAMPPAMDNLSLMRSSL